MKIWIQELGWEGCIIVIADSEEKARQLMQAGSRYKESEPIQSFPIEDGFFYECLGDA